MRNLCCWWDPLSSIVRRFEVSTGFRGPNITSAPSFQKQRLFSWKGQRHASEVRFKGNMYMNMVRKEIVKVRYRCVQLRQWHLTWTWILQPGHATAPIIILGINELLMNVLIPDQSSGVQKMIKNYQVLTDRIRTTGVSAKILTLGIFLFW